MNLSDVSLTAYLLLSHECRDLHEMVWLNIDPNAALCSFGTKAFVPEHH